MSTEKIQTDRGICKFFIMDKCRRGDGCQWAHTKNQCNLDDCDVFTEKKICYKCNKKARVAKNAAYKERLKKDGYRCANNTGGPRTCHGWTLFGDYCNTCFAEASQYIVGPCRNKQCNNRVKGGRGYCIYCQQEQN